MIIKTIASLTVMATAAALFAYSLNAEPVKKTADEAEGRDAQIFLVASYPVGDFIEPWKDFAALVKIEGHTEKEAIDAFNRCKLLVFDRKVRSGESWRFASTEHKGWPKFLLQGETIFRLGDTTLAVEKVEKGGSTNWPQKRKVGIGFLVRRINQGHLPKFKDIFKDTETFYQSVDWVTHRFLSRFVEYDCEGKVVLSPVNQE